MLQGPGENAGVLDLGDGLAVAFKVESHNHPSAVEPFQGAATGVGGILRDISAMGARPVALLDGLRFGAPDDHFSRAVGGVGHYGNCVGVPNVGGEVVFDEAYASNCLVNAMCVGLLPAERLTRAKATQAGALVVLYGATTGRDGIGGASVLASAELGEDDADKRPSVQVGDPFTGKRLIEVSVELVERGLVLSLQDCGAAGLASSLSEMAADYGIDVHLDRVPQREEGMEPWEVMISESQERMVAIVAPERLAEVEAVIDRWELHRAVIGEVTDTGLLRALWDGDEVGAIPARLLTEECPRYAVEREPRSPPPRAPTAACRRRARRCSSCSRRRSSARERSSTRRYDQLVQSRTVRRPGLDAAVLRLRPDWRGLALTLDGQGRARLARPAPRRAARDPRGRAQRRVRRRRAARLHRLPQLRQPREARDRLGARGDDRGHGARLRGARRADRLGERLALQRHRRPLDPPDARRRLRRPRARRPRVPRGWQDGRRDPPRPLALAAHARRLGGAGALGLARAACRRSTSPSEVALVRYATRAAPARLARPRRLRGRPRRRARRGGALERRSARSSSSTTIRSRSSARSAAR